MSDVKRLFHRTTGRPMPVVKIFHESHEELLITINKELGLKFNGKQTYVEAERRQKVVRCFNCMRFGHNGSTCLLPQQCENCGEAHSATNCPRLTFQDASTVEEHIKPHQVNVQCIKQSFEKSRFKTFYKHKLTMKILSLNCQAYNTAKKAFIL